MHSTGEKRSFGLLGSQPLGSALTTPSAFRRRGLLIRSVPGIQFASLPIRPFYVVEARAPNHREHVATIAKPEAVARSLDIRSRLGVDVL